MTNSDSKYEVVECRSRKSKNDFPLLIVSSKLAPKGNETKAYAEELHFCE